MAGSTIQLLHGNFVATVMLCQGMAEQMLASHLAIGIDAKPPPKRVRFDQTLERCLDEGVISKRDAEDLDRLMSLRNPPSHYRGINDESNLERWAIDARITVREHPLADASFAIAATRKRRQGMALPG